MHKVLAAAFGLILTGCACGDCGRVHPPVGLGRMSHATVEGLVGKRVGRTLADDDIAKGEAAEFRALEFSRGSAVEWHSTIDDSHGKVVAGDTSRINDLTCRRYTHTVYILGRPQVGSGTACRQINGSWRLINN